MARGTARKPRRGAGWAAAGLGLVAASAAPLDLPTVVWIGGVIVGVLMLACGALLYRFGKEQPMTPSTGDEIHITTGDVTASTIVGKIVSPQPGLKMELVAQNREAGEVPAIGPQIQREGLPLGEPKYVTRAILGIDAGYAASALRVEVRGTKIADATLDPEPVQHPGGTTSSKNHSSRSIAPNGASLRVGGPLAARWVVDVRTTEPDEVRIQPVLDPL